MMVGVFDRVFETAPVFRAEKHNTKRHLNEYTSLDFEMGYIDGFEDIMACLLYTSTTKDAIDKLRAQGEKVGLLKIRLYRPFPAEAIAEALKNVKAVAVMDRAEGYTNHGGPLGSDVMAAMFRARSTALATNIIYGLGGRDVRVEMCIRDRRSISEYTV